MRAAAALLLSTLAGCSTIGDSFNGGNSEPYLGQSGPNVMGGVRMDVAHFGDSGCKAIMMPFYLMDLPFSFALDLAFLPFTLPYNLLRPGPPTLKSLEEKP